MVEDLPHRLVVANGRRLHAAHPSASNRSVNAATATGHDMQPRHKRIRIRGTPGIAVAGIGTPAVGVGRCPTSESIASRGLAGSISLEVRHENAACRVRPVFD